MNFKVGDIVKHKICMVNLVLLRVSPVFIFNNQREPNIICRFIKTDGGYWTENFHEFELELVKP